MTGGIHLVQILLNRTFLFGLVIEPNKITREETTVATAAPFIPQLGMSRKFANKLHTIATKQITATSFSLPDASKMVFAQIPDKIKQDIEIANIFRQFPAAMYSIPPTSVIISFESTISPKAQGKESVINKLKSLFSKSLMLP